MSRGTPKAMSLESALDQERREVMNILEGRPSLDNPTRRDRPVSPAPPIRSMLDITSPKPRQPSNAGTSGPTLPPNQTNGQTIRSMLDPTGPPAPSVSPTPSVPSMASLPSPRISQSAVGSPITEKPPTQDRHRSASDTSSSPVEGLRKIMDKQGLDLNQDYQFGMLPSIPNQALPKRVGQGGKPLLSSSAMAAAMSGELGRGRDSGRHNSTTGVPRDSRSPSSRLTGRTSSPSLRTSSSLNPVPTPGTYVTDSGKVIDMDKAYRRLSDIAFRKLGSSLAPKRKSSVKGDGVSGENTSPEPNARLAIDSEGEAEHSGVETSDDDQASSDEEDYKSEASRGRRRNRWKKPPGNSEGEWEDVDGDKGGLETTIGMGRGKGPRKIKSLLAAAEEERMAVAAKTGGGEPAISITGPGSEKMMPKKSGVHPITSFDHTASGYNSDATTDNEGDWSDIKRAQELSINMSHVDNSVPNRAMRTILRGDFAKLEEEAEEGLRRQRMYLVATDLSDEAVYALEWTIGTILRDGDTLFAMYSVDEETGTGKAGDGDSTHNGHFGEGAKAARDAVSTMATLTEKAKNNPVPNASLLVPHGYLPATDASSRAASTDARSMSRLEAERFHAIDDISQTCIRLLRKTRLQVRVAVEVIHCKSPKHMITEAIDTLSPTLVILGSRGRSALKGVLLGSFSNYLVTKSSVPVMVARKKLRKHAKYRPSVAGSGLRLSNNLLTQKKVGGLGLANAKID